MSKRKKIIIGVLIFIILWKMNLLDDAILVIMTLVFGAYFLFCLFLGLIAGITSSFSKEDKRPSHDCMRGVDKSVAGCISMCDGCKWRRGSFCTYF